MRRSANRCRILALAGATAVLAATSMQGSVALASTPSDGLVYAWGYDGYGELGNGAGGSNIWNSTPAPVGDLANAIAVTGSAGGETGYALLSDGTVSAWGYGGEGDLGDGETATSDVAVRVVGLTNVTAIAAGMDNGYALRSDGTVWAWGDNYAGELGNGTLGGLSTVPQMVPGLSGVTSIAASLSTAFAVLADGTVRAWGNNIYGTLGDGTTGGRSASPVAVQSLTSIVSVSGSGVTQDGYALRSDGTVWAWGYNGAGTLGNGTSGNGTTAADSNVPVQVSGLTGVRAIAGRYALLNDGTVRAWGSDYAGDLGNGDSTYSESDTPVTVTGLSNITAIAGGSFNGYALDKDGRVWAWGDNAFGELGPDVSNATSSTPALVASLPTVRAIGAATGTAFAVAGTATPPTTLTSAAAGQVFLGEPISDQVLLGGTTPGAGGTITFDAYANSTCTTLVFESAPVPVSGSGTYPTTQSDAQFVPSATGTYYWTASYSGNGDNRPVTNGCNSPGSTSVVLPPRYVALGDSVPYGHGLANPYPTTQIGVSGASQGPSTSAYPALVADALGLALKVRADNCTLTGDDLTISGANAATADARAGNNQCPSWADSQSVQRDELPAAGLLAGPAKLVTIQAGADDIDFGDCMAWELTKFAAWHLQGTRCVVNGTVIPSVQTALNNLRSALLDEIKSAAPFARNVVVVNYYQVIPNPKDFNASSVHPGGQVDPVCLGLSQNTAGAYKDAVIIQSALNTAIARAVMAAKAAGISNVQLLDVSNLESGHEICTGSPALFAGEPMTSGQFHTDVETIGACKLYFSKSCQTTEPFAENDLKRHIWRAAHPNQFGQRDIARALVALRTSAAP